MLRTWRKTQYFLNKSSAEAEMGDHGHNRHGLKRWGLLCPFRAELGPRLIQCSRAEVYFRTKWRLHPSSRLVTINMDQKLGGCVPSVVGVAGSHRTQSRLGQGLPTPSAILVHPVVWPQRTWPKIGGDCVPLGEGNLSLHLTQSRLG